MAPAAPAYRQPERAPQRAPRIHVVPGRGTPSAPRTIAPLWVFIAKFAAIVFVVFALLGCIRIALVSATVSTAVAAESVSSQIESARAAGNELEVRESYLSNPGSLRSEALDLGMSEALATTSITLPPDVVVTDAEGNLSLAGSLKAISKG